MSYRRLDLRGQQYGRLTPIEPVGRSKTGLVLWLCQCSCGSIKIASGSTIKRGKIQSCGCIAKEVGARNRAATTKHGFADTNIYRRYLSMHQRCYNKNTKGYANYGGRGIGVCAEWHTPEPFILWSLENGYSKELTLDRIDTNMDYSPENCRWTTYKVNINNRRITAKASFNGREYTMSELSDISCIKADTLWHRIFELGWDTAKALTEPVRKTGI